MNPEPVTSWITSFPAELDARDEHALALADLHERLAGRAPPSGRFVRMWALSTLPAKLFAAYSLGWVRARFGSVEERERARAEAHWQAALYALGTMGYLRGAVTKAGQVLASYPDVLPRQVVELFATLHSEAPPMHFALLRELVRGELGASPEELFAEFEPTAFAAASIGQVHRARLSDGTAVAVKIQYPGIARAIRADLANARLLLLPLRLGRDWENLMEQLTEISRGLEHETDYLREALWTERARAHLIELDDVVVPRVFAGRSSARVLSTELLRGAHLDEFLATKPAQELRDRHAAAITRAGFRLWSSQRMFNTDPGPGNFLFLADGRTDLLDFGSCREFDAQEWELMRLGLRASREGGEAQRESIRRSAQLERLDPDSPQARALHATCEWLWAPLRHQGPFDFGDDDYLAQGVRLFGESLRQGHTRQAPVFVYCLRQFFGVRALLWALGARIDFRAIAEEEYARAGL